MSLIEICLTLSIEMDKGLQLLKEMLYCSLVKNLVFQQYFSEFCKEAICPKNNNNNRAKQ